MRSNTRNRVKSAYSLAPLKLDHVKTYPLASRPSKVCRSDFAKRPPAEASLNEWVNSLPRTLAGESSRAVAAVILSPVLLGVTIVKLDFVQHYRPLHNVLLRPTAPGDGEAGVIR